MQKLILHCDLSPGDIVMLTAAVRDLHHFYPGEFVTDVRTSCPDLWDNNPYLTRIEDDDAKAKHLRCVYPLINDANQKPYHCLHGFIDFLNQRLGLSIKPTAFKGDIHLSAQEKAWYSQVREVTKIDIPFWIVAAGGKHDVTIKWWDSRRYQEVVDHFHDRIQFVQVGAPGHHHPRLEGTIDLRGQTTLRELVRLVYHAQGVLCSVTALMHLAAAVEPKSRRLPTRPCVVVAGGREPAHWETYPGHQFIHTIGALPCCLHGGCWKDRILPLRDGDVRDRPANRCSNVVGTLPACMDMISSDEVVRRIKLFFDGGAIRYLTARERDAAQRGVKRTSRNDYDRQPLTLHAAGTACDDYIRRIPPYPGKYYGRGIVICGGGPRYFPSAWVCIKMLRRLGCSLPIQLWYLGAEELNQQMRELVAPLGVQCVDALEMRKQFPIRRLKGWELKSYAILHSPFREVLLLDADNVAVVNPEFLFETHQFRTSAALFWPDYDAGRNSKMAKIWRSCGLAYPDELEFESGQIVVDKERCWRALCLSVWLNENSDFYYQYLHGDKETFHIAFRKEKQSYSLVPWPIHRLPATMCQHDFDGRRIFQHRNLDKWDFFLRNDVIKGFWYEAECRQDLRELQQCWDGGVSLVAAKHRPPLSSARAGGRPVRIQIVMISSTDRQSFRQQTLANLAKTDWDGEPLHVQLDTGAGNSGRRTPTHCAFLALEQSLSTKTDYVLMLDDDLEFNRHFRHNLQTWQPLRAGRLSMASLYNPGVTELACDVHNEARLVAPQQIIGTPAVLLSRQTAAYLVRHWDEAHGRHHRRISRLAARLANWVFYHPPSLVQHLDKTKLPDGSVDEASDFDPDWKRPPDLVCRP